RVVLLDVPALDAGAEVVPAGRGAQPMSLPSDGRDGLADRLVAAAQDEVAGLEEVLRAAGNDAVVLNHVLQPGGLSPPARGGGRFVRGGRAAAGARPPG